MDLASSTQPPPPLAERFRVAGLACGGLVAAIGATALAGWMLGIEMLKGGFLGITIKTNTGLCLLASGLALLLLAPEPVTRLRRAAGCGLAGLAAAIGLATMSEHLFGWDLGIDQILFRETAGAVATQSPNRMGPPASVCFPLFGIALVLLGTARPGARAAWQPLALFGLLVALIPLLGYVFQVRQLYGIARYSGISLHTAIGFAALGLGILFVRPSAGLMHQVTAPDGGGLLLRRLLPAAVILPVVLAWLRMLGQDAGYYDLEFGRTLLVLSYIVAFSLLTWWTSTAVSRHARARRRAEAAEDEMKVRLVEALESERAARAAAERSNRMKDEFLATLSHELRTPLQAIVGWSQVLARGEAGAPDVRRGLEAIERNARTQAQLIRDLLDLARIASGTLRLDTGRVDLAALSESALVAAAPAATAKRIRVERDYAAGLPAVRGDATRLEQVLWNLVGNAVKFTPAGGTVRAILRRDGDTIELAIQDTGIGIAPELLDQVFERFRQADSSTTRSHGGLGIGLSIARQITELHGGTLVARSAGPGHGATFVVRLPVATSDAEDGAVAPTAFGDPEALAGTRILVVDDQDDAREIVGRILGGCGARVLAVDGVDAALAALERETFDVVVSDVGMPGRDGYDLARALSGRRPPVPVIALTAFARDEDRELARRAGFRLHLTKPVDPAHLVAGVAEALRATTPA